MFSLTSRKHFSELTEQQVLALAISNEEDDARIFRGFAQKLRPEYPASAAFFDEMASEEDEHRRVLIDLHAKRFGDVVPLIRREHVAGFYARKTTWLAENLGPDQMREEASAMEATAEAFYERAAQASTDAGTRKLLGDLAAEEGGHKDKANSLTENLSDEALESENATAHRQFVLTYVQPGLAGLIDGSISTLAPIFATAFATKDPWTTLLVGLAASIGAGISMGFTEVASDDGVISGRGSPITRGVVTGIMTTLGGLGHALPYLITDFWTATYVAFAIVAFELFVITWIQHKYMETPWMKALFQILLGGLLVLGVGILIGQG